MLGMPPPASLLAAADASTPGSVIPPVVILVMCLVGGAGTVLMLPSRSEAPVRKIGGVVLLGAGLIVAALLVRAAARAPGGGMGVYFWVFSAIALAGALRVVTHTRPVYSALYFVLTVFATAGLFILLWAEFMAAALVLIYAGAILVTYVFVIMLATSSAAPASATGVQAAGEPAAGGNGHARAPATPDPAAAAAIAEHDAVSREPVVAAAVGFALMGVLLLVVFDRAGEAIRPLNRDPATLRSYDSFPPSARPAQAPPVAPTDLPVAQGATQRLGLYLFQNHLVNLELAGLILTVSMVGAIVIARRRIVAPEVAAAAAPGAAARRDVFIAPMTPIDDNPHSIPVYGTENPRQKAYPEA